MLIDDYLDYCRQARERYGERTAVLMQCGDFFEIYSYPSSGNGDADANLPDIYAIADICNLTVTRKAKAVAEASRGNPWMAGFPLHALEKHRQLLLQEGYTVALVEQVSPPPNPSRRMTDVSSPGMNMPRAEDAQRRAPGFFVVFCAEANALGIAGIDVNTGHTWVYEAARGACPDEAVRILGAFPALEILWIGPRPDGEATLAEAAEGCRAIHWRTQEELGSTWLRPCYQNEVLRRCFGPWCGILQPIEAAGLERYHLGRLAFVQMIQFAYEHRESLVQMLSLPQHLDHGSRFLLLEHNSAMQLQVIGQDGERPLLHWLNRCATPMGARLFRERVLTPLADPEAIRARYDRITDILGLAAAPSLRGCMDLERMARRMVRGQFGPMEWTGFVASLRIASDALRAAGASGEAILSAGQLVEDAEGVLDLEEASRYSLADLRGNIFRQGREPELEAHADTIRREWQWLQDTADEISAAAAEAPGTVRVESNERDGCYIITTKRRWDKAVAASRAAAPFWASATPRPISSTSANVQIRHARIAAASDRIVAEQRQLAAKALEKYQRFVSAYIGEWQGAIYAVARAIAELDVELAAARNAKEYGYVRPSLVATAGGHPAMHATDMRHPILERLREDVPYVPNSLSIEAGKGMLLYGINASGKSSLMKAVGLNLIMAQAGMFVACGSFEYTPWRHLFTRIGGADSIYRGLSSFGREMGELRNILQRCDGYSLVLGDELCAGTEAVSALAIVAAGTESILGRGAAFMFATHLHELPDIPEVAARVASGEIEMAHLHVEVATDGTLVYDRRLRPGRGTGLYGVEVCKGLGMPDAFLGLADRIRRRLQQVPDAVVAPTASRYNGSVYVDRCGVCGAPASETHHIRYQKDADTDGFVAPGLHKDAAGNLVPLCESCHTREHRGKIHIRGYVETSMGRVLAVEEAPAPASAAALSPPAPVPILAEVRACLRRDGQGWWGRRSKRATWRRLDAPDASPSSLAGSLLKFPPFAGMAMEAVGAWLEGNMRSISEP